MPPARLSRRTRGSLVEGAWAGWSPRGASREDTARPDVCAAGAPASPGDPSFGVAALADPASAAEPALASTACAEAAALAGAGTEEVPESRPVAALETGGP